MSLSSARACIYRAYQFAVYDPVIDEIRTICQGISPVEIAEKSGVSRRTVENWFGGRTKRPQFATVRAIARSMGHDFVLVDGDGRRVERVPTSHRQRRAEATAHA